MSVANQELIAGFLLLPFRLPPTPFVNALQMSVASQELIAGFLLLPFRLPPTPFVNALQMSVANQELIAGAVADNPALADCLVLQCGCALLEKVRKTLNQSCF